MARAGECGDHPKEREAWRVSLERGRPFGDDAWRIKMVADLCPEHTIRAEGRPKRGEPE